ncbi:MAG: thymidine phosphorylase [Clostridia bacterium]|nr:thymidine phosphorylase [Clostridia bacterium]
MQMIDLIRKKRDGGEHSPEELAWLVQGITGGRIPDYQVAAWCMAVYFQGMSPREVRSLTLQMAASGEQLDLSALPQPVIDKHSSGGVGDKTSLVLAPLITAAGVPVCKMSGRGLGHTGGTVDKLESIPGFRVELSREEFIRQARAIGIALTAQGEDLCPADKILYALRDTTATVESIPLIASSIMSKKLAGGAAGFVLDVKVGNGAFMKDLEEAKTLAQLMVAIGKGAGKKMVAVLTNMDQPLGRAAGNALEVREAIAFLRGETAPDLLEVTLALGAHMLKLAGAVAGLEEGRKKLHRLLFSGQGLEVFAEWVAAQGGDPRVIEKPELLPAAPVVRPVLAPGRGFVARMATDLLGRIAGDLGAGRKRKEDTIDPAVGLIFHKKPGDLVEPGELLAEVHARTEEEAAGAGQIVLQAIELAPEPPLSKPLIYGYIV